MSDAPATAEEHPSGAADTAIAVVSAYGAFRVLLVLLAVWSFFAGFALLTQGVSALSFGGSSPAAERALGAHMIIVAPVYGLLAWRRSEYRLLIWVPYAAQLAIVVPALWELFFGSHDIHDALLLIVSIIFLVMFVYVWWSSHPLGHFQSGEMYEEQEEEDGADDADETPDVADGPTRVRRYRRTK